MEGQTNSESRLWQAVLEREARFDGRFVYAVQTTGIYCRPSCPSRKPARRNVAFYPLPEVAEQAGFRPCRRCRPDRPEEADPQVEQARRICRYVEAHLDEPLTLEALGERFHQSPTHLQRTFKEVVGVSPQQYAEACRMGQVRALLRQGNGIGEAAYGAGFGSISRLYDKADAQLGMTPATYRQDGTGVQIGYTLAACPLGRLLVAATARGICAVKLGDDDGALEEALQAEFSQARLRRDDEGLGSWLAAIVRHLEGDLPHLDLPLDVRATAFQRQVWQELQTIPYGETRSYGQVARAIGRPGSARAVAQACAANPAALVVPCHRVVRQDGQVGGYRWGVARKEALLQQEAAGQPAGEGER
ncbi:MAG: bifunctional DNA-binding transcriptional regulator/O6-methylguanine-DNA methyltransferase Ada [Anaerolineae bacterium]|jgi:AraC family transcriptional regulator of adaptative response/methylated-DNA-[protein]-cysteine methyltransferase